ncbi:MAG: HPr(Ser) kinase/phosphatase [Clostridia bacterium]|nr:HPr(Ser) kinase/phosphatase [Clostridia bacterium]
MATVFSVTLAKIIEEFSLETVFMPADPEEIKITSADINRPGLQLNGFYDYYDNTRLQLFGKAESTFVENFTPAQKAQSFDRLCSTKPPAIIIARSLPIEPYLIDKAKLYGVPILSSSDGTSELIAALIAFLNVQLAPRITRHGVLVEVYGEGILLLGESGVGKSETAIELVKRGHRLIADDAVEIRRVSNKSLVGSSPDNIRHFIELRGIGIINARRIFGMGAVKITEKIDMVVQLEVWDGEKVYDRMGLKNEYAEILGIQVPKYTIPIKPGRNLAIILEVAAMNNRQKKMGYNAAQELMAKLGMTDFQL